ncbi:MAG: RNA 2',3'-cyclic phosphodiesterase [Candidatus Altiarchaeota archaeon]|nr:RNA 2',3'-cyclic phosphodiesterase [Candidatus Altiarchaeota archaeon]
MDSVRCFIALEVPEELCKKVAELGWTLSKKITTGIKPVSQKNIHITLRFLGEMGAGKLSQVGTALDALRDSGSFEIKLRGLGGFPNHHQPRVVWVGVEAPLLLNLKKQVDSAIFQLGFSPESRFAGHLTVARVRTPEGQKLARDFIKEGVGLEIGSFTAKEVVLKQSILSSAGPEYRVIRGVKL